MDPFNRILIGAPVYKRAWIMDDWFDCIAAQYGKFDLGFVFEMEPDDSDTLDVIQSRVRDFDPWLFRVSTKKRGSIEHSGNSRHWNLQRYEMMAQMRNDLLEVARETEPDRYFSLDSDILLEDRETMKKLFKATSRDAIADAANPLMFMTPSTNVAPSFMTWNEFRPDHAHRADISIGQPRVVDVIMAAKMMNKKAYYNANYYAHRQGEDIGWSDNCRTHGIKLACLTNVYAVHIMSQDMLKEYKTGGDPRKKYLKSD